MNEVYIVLTSVLLSVWSAVGAGIYFGNYPDGVFCAESWSVKQHIFAFLMAGPIIWITKPIIIAFYAIWKLLK